MYAGIRYDDGYLCILDKEDGTMDIVRGVSIVQSPWDAWVPSCQVPTEYVGNRHWDTWVPYQVPTEYVGASRVT